MEGEGQTDVRADRIPGAGSAKMPLRQTSTSQSGVRCKQAQHYGLNGKWKTPPKVKVNEVNDQAKIQWDFRVQADKKLIANQPGNVVVDKQQKKALAIDVAIPSDTTIKKKQHENLKEYQGLREGARENVESEDNGGTSSNLSNWCHNTELEEWLQQIPGDIHIYSYHVCKSETQLWLFILHLHQQTSRKKFD